VAGQTSAEPVLAESDGPDLAAITQRLTSMEDIVVSDVALDTDQGRITVFNLPARPETCSHIFQAIAGAAIVVDMILYNLTGPGRAEVSFSVPRQDLDRALHITRGQAQALNGAGQVVADADIARAATGRLRSRIACLLTTHPAWPAPGGRGSPR
jgi:aspartate kinase